MTMVSMPMTTMMFSFMVVMVAMMGMSMRRGFAALLQMPLDFSLVKLVCVTLDYPDCILGALAKTGTKSVAEIIRREHRLAVDHLYSPFSA
jgi:hypothetical protein